MIASSFQYPGGKFELGCAPPRLVGVVNVTPDSFSDGGRFLEPSGAVRHALELEAAGAAVIDIGGVSTRPGSNPVTEGEELERVLPVVEALAARLRVPLSVDTFRPGVFRRCFAAGARILNDVTGLRDDAMIDVLRETGAAAFLMHMQGEPSTMQSNPHYRDVVTDVESYFRGLLDRLHAAGIPKNRIAVDPGIGFGKTLDHNLALLRRIAVFRELGTAVLVGASRKSFLGKILDRPEPSEREWATVACTAHSWNAGVDFVRVHDVRANADVINVLEAIKGSRPS